MISEQSANAWLPKKAWFTVTEVATALDIGRTHCYDLIRSGELKPNQTDPIKFSRPRLALYLDKKAGIDDGGVQYEPLRFADERTAIAAYKAIVHALFGEKPAATTFGWLGADNGDYKLADISSNEWQTMTCWVGYP